MCFAPQRRALFRHFFDIWTSKSGPRPSVFNTFDLEMCFAPQRRALFRHRNFQKWSENGVFCTFWLRNVLSRHNGVHFFDISTSKSGPNPWCFVTFWLANVLRATTACTFWTSQLPKVVRSWGCFVHFDFEMCFAPQRRAIFHLSFGQAGLRTRRFSEPTFRLSGATNPLEKHSVSRLFLPFRASASSFFWLFLFWSSLF